MKKTRRENMADRENPPKNSEADGSLAEKYPGNKKYFVKDLEERVVWTPMSSGSLPSTRVTLSIILRRSVSSIPGMKRTASRQSG
jgi:hypothetical protein